MMYFLTSSAEKRASGNFITKENPGTKTYERQENLQLPNNNDASRLEKVEAQKAAVVLESTVAPQEEWANQNGYVAREGMKQTFTPTRDTEGAIHAGIYKVQESR